MICWLKIILIGILPIFVFQDMSEDVAFKDMSEIRTENILSTNNNISFEESSSNYYLERTINHILKSRYADLSMPVCFIGLNCKDNNDNKSILAMTGETQKSNITNRYYNIYFKNYSNCHNLAHSPKDYYIYTLEKIII